MRIAYLVPDPGIPIGGTKGASSHVASLSAALAAAGADVTLFAAKVTTDSFGGTRVVPIDMGEVPSGIKGEIARIEGTRRFYERVLEHFGQGTFDVIYERLSLFANGGDLSARSGIGRLVEVNAPVAKEREEHFGLVHRVEAREAEDSALKDARVVAVSNPLSAWSRSRGAKSVTVVPNGANTTWFRPAVWKAHRLEIRNSFHLGDLPVLGFVGSLKAWHGLKVLFDALEIVGKTQELGLVIVGDGPLLQNLKARSRELPASIRTTFTGAIAQADVPAYLAAMDVAVAPYVGEEPFYFSPLKVAEYMAAGLPVIASDFESVRVMVGQTGRLVPPGDPQALAGALSELAADPLRREILGEMARDRAVACLDWSTVAEITLREAELAVHDARTLLPWPLGAGSQRR